jgi:3'-phosphoadenosine 5'-phosphosulfate sulfotransferase
MHKTNNIQEAIRLALEFETAFKGNHSQRGLKRSNESDIHQSTGKRSKTTLLTEMEVVPRGVLDLLDSKKVILRRCHKLWPNLTKILLLK